MLPNAARKLDVHHLSDRPPLVRREKLNLTKITLCIRREEVKTIFRQTDNRLVTACFSASTASPSTSNHGRDEMLRRVLFFF